MISCVRSTIANILENLEFLHQFYILKSDGCLQRVPPECQPVRKRRGGGGKRLQHLVRRQYASDNAMGRRDAFRACYDVGIQFVARRGEPLAELAERIDHFVRADQDSVSIAYFSDPLVVASRR